MDEAANQGGRVSAWRKANNGDYQGNFNFDYNFFGDFPAGTKVVGTGDFNDDGWTDTLFQVPSDLEPGVSDLQIAFANNLSLVGTLFIDQEVPVGSNAVGVADFNGDGMPDVLVQNQKFNLSVWVMDPSDPETVSEVIPLGKSVKSGTDRFLGFCDVDDDGLADILIQRTKKAVTYWKSTGTDVERDVNNKIVENPLLVLRPNLGVYNTVHVVGSMDVDGDGSIDLVVRRDNGGGDFSVWVMFNDGAGGFPAAMQNQYRKAGKKMPIGVGMF